MSLESMDELNQKIYEQCSYKSGPVYLGDFITSKTDLEFDNYGNAPKAFLAQLGIPATEWDKLGSVYVLRSCVLTPYLTSNVAYDEFWGIFSNTMRKILRLIVKSK